MLISWMVVFVFALLGVAAEAQQANRPPDGLVCIEPIFLEERRILKDKSLDVNNAVRAIHYLRTKYCAYVEDNVVAEGKITLPDKCILYRGTLRGERVFWGECK